MLNTLGIGQKKVFKQPNGRIIYYDYAKKRAYTITPEKQKNFPLYQNRYLLAVLVVALAIVFNVPLGVSLLAGALVAMGMEYFFKTRYLPNLSYTERFDLEKAIEQEKKVAKEPVKKTVLRIVVYLAFAVVLVLNAYDLKMDQSAIIACWVISGFITVLVLKMVIELFTRKEN